MAKPGTLFWRRGASDAPNPVDYVRSRLAVERESLILPHMQCLLGNEGKCPEVVAWEPIARSLNMFFEDE